MWNWLTALLTWMSNDPNQVVIEYPRASASVAAAMASIESENVSPKEAAKLTTPGGTLPAQKCDGPQCRVKQ